MILPTVFCLFVKVYEDKCVLEFYPLSFYRSLPLLHSLSLDGSKLRKTEPMSSRTLCSLKTKKQINIYIELGRQTPHIYIYINRKNLYLRIDFMSKIMWNITINDIR